MFAYLGSKRGVTRGVAPIIEQSSILLAGVTSGFLDDLNSGKHVSVMLSGNWPWERRRQAANKQKERSHLLMEAFCLLTDRAFALFDVVGGFFVALAWIRSKQLGGVKWLNVYLHDNTQLCWHYLPCCARGVFILWTGFGPTLFLCGCSFRERINVKKSSSNFYSFSNDEMLDLI